MELLKMGFFAVDITSNRFLKKIRFIKIRRTNYN